MKAEQIPLRLDSLWTARTWMTVRWRMAFSASGVVRSRRGTGQLAYGDVLDDRLVEEAVPASGSVRIRRGTVRIRRGTGVPVGSRQDPSSRGDDRTARPRMRSSQQTRRRRMIEALNHRWRTSASNMEHGTLPRMRMNRRILHRYRLLAQPSPPFATTGALRRE